MTLKKFPMPNQDPECEVHHHLMGDGRCSCLAHDEVFGSTCDCKGRGWFTDDMMGGSYSACKRCNTHEIWHGMPRLKNQQAPGALDHLLEILADVPSDVPVQIEYRKLHDVRAVEMARRQAELLSRYAAELERPIVSSNLDTLFERRDRAKLAREMSVIYFRAAELEEKP